LNAVKNLFASHIHTLWENFCYIANHTLCKYAFLSELKFTYCSILSSHILQEMFMSKY